MVIKLEVPISSKYIFVGDVKEVLRVLLGAYKAEVEYNPDGPNKFKLVDNDMEISVMPDCRVVIEDDSRDAKIARLRKEIDALLKEDEDA